MDFDAYQEQALRTDQSSNLGLDDNTSRIEAALGLVGEAGSIADILKKEIRDGIGVDARKNLLKTELGDTLWYLAALSKKLGFDLGDIAAYNLQRVQSRYGEKDLYLLLEEEMQKKRLDSAFPAKERFPDLLLFQFEEILDEDQRPKAQMSIVDVAPIAFPSGREGSEKGQGFGLPQSLNVAGDLGDPLRDNSTEEDGYRYHDALHIAFMAVLGWSPVMRALLRLKRKSVSEVDDSEDSLRSCDVEEGLSTRLFRRSWDYNGFQEYRNVDNSTIDLVLESVRKLEVEQKPGWLWKIAIVRGFKAWRFLFDNRGGFLLANLRTGAVDFSKSRPIFPDLEA